MDIRDDFWIVINQLSDEDLIDLMKDYIEREYIEMRMLSFEDDEGFMEMFIYNVQRLIDEY